MVRNVLDFFDGFGNVLLENEFWCKNDYCMDLKHHQNNTKHHKNMENTPKFSDRLRRPEIPTIGMKNHRNFFLGQKTIGIFYFYSYGSYGSMGVNHILVSTPLLAIIFLTSFTKGTGLISI